MPDVRPAAERFVLDGPAGGMEILLEQPAGPVTGIAFIAHPHPLYGGTLDNKVAATLARTFLAMGWVAVRPNFRGVGGSAGGHDNGRGETTDFLFLVDALPRLRPLLPVSAQALRVALAGFSFGSFVVANVARELALQGRAAHALVLVGAAAGKWPMPAVDPATLVIHGEADETIPLAAVLAWAGGCGVPVVVVPGADHFFHRRLTIIKRLVMQNLLGADRLDAGADE